MNIMLNQVCNLTCPYCFADEFVNVSREELERDKSQITLENYKKAMDFVIKSGEERIGIIGGEPLLHPQFREIIEMTVHSPIKSIIIFTNGVLLDEHMDFLKQYNDRLRYLINVNSPKDIGQAQYNRLCKNLDEAHTGIPLTLDPEGVSLGMNFYDKDMDYQFMLDLLKKHNKFRMRTSNCSPSRTCVNRYNAEEYFKNVVNETYKLYRDLAEINVLPGRDCNLVPRCYFSEEQLEKLEEDYERVSRLTKNYDKAYLGYINCRGAVLDCLPNLDVVRCFGISDQMKLPMDKFQNTAEMRTTFETFMDDRMNTITTKDECNGCKAHTFKQCTGACNVFKLKQFEEMNEEYNILEKGQYRGGYTNEDAE